MGMLNNSGNNGLVRFLRTLIIKLFIQFNDKFIFLGIGEYENAKQNFKKNDKFFFLSFVLTLLFGKARKNISRQQERRYYLLETMVIENSKKLLKLQKLCKIKNFYLSRLMKK